MTTCERPVSSAAMDPKFQMVPRAHMHSALTDAAQSPKSLPIALKSGEPSAATQSVCARQPYVTLCTAKWIRMRAHVLARAARTDRGRSTTATSVSKITKDHAFGASTRTRKLVHADKRSREPQQSCNCDPMHPGNMCTRCSMERKRPGTLCVQAFKPLTLTTTGMLRPT